MKKLAVIIIVMLVAGLWVMPVERAKAQTELERVESEIRGLELFAEMCGDELDKLQAPGPTAAAEEWAKYEKELSLLEQCAANMETRLKWLRERLGRLPTPPSTTAPRERAKWRKKIDEWEKRVAAAEEKKKRIKTRLEKLRKANKRKQPAPGYTVENKSSDGLATAIFSTPYGKLSVNLPANRAAGNTISGTLVAEPLGNTYAGDISLMSLSINSMPSIVSLSPNPDAATSTTFDFTMQMPNAHPSVDVTLVTLKDKYGVVKAECTLPLNQTNSPSATTNGPKQFQFPTTSQNGRPLEIVGPFDGNFKTTEIKIGGQPARLLAESPSSCLVLAPDQNFGPTEITVKEGDVEAKGSCRNLGLRLAAPKTSLLKSETTVLTVTVEGLKGIQQNVPLLLEKQGVVSMAGGDTQTVQIRPTDVRADGTFETKRTLTGLQAGSFGVTATVIDPARRPIIIPLTENAKVNGFRVKNEGDKFVIYVENVRSPITGKPVDGEHKLEHNCAALSKVPFLGRLFLDKGNGKADTQCLMLMVTARIIIQDEE